MADDTDVPAEKNFVFMRGATKTIRITCKANNAAVNLTGSILNFLAVAYDGTAVFNRDMTLDDAPAGVASVEFTPEETDAMPVNTSIQYEISRAIGSEKKILLAGSVIVRGIDK